MTKLVSLRRPSGQPGQVLLPSHLMGLVLKAGAGQDSVQLIFQKI